jgi:hypothetical protein
MAERWFYRDVANVIGPLSASELKEAARNGTINKDTPIRTETHLKWVSAHRVKGLFQVVKSIGESIAPNDQQIDNSLGTSTKKSSQSASGKSDALNNKSNDPIDYGRLAFHLPKRDENVADRSKITESKYVVGCTASIVIVLALGWIVRVDSSNTVHPSATPIDQLTTGDTNAFISQAPDEYQLSDLLTRDVFIKARRNYTQYGWNEALLNQTILSQIEFQRNSSLENLRITDDLLVRF